MKRAVLFAALLFMGLAPGLEAKARPCVPARCGEKLPCELRWELMKEKATLRAVNTVSKEFLGILDATDVQVEQEVNRFAQAMSKEMSKWYRKYGRCKPQYFYSEAERFGINQFSKCEITTYDQKSNRSLEQALAESNSCSELVEAEYAAAQARQSRCQAELQKDKADRFKPGGLAEFKDLYRSEAQAKVDSIRASLRKRGCSTKKEGTAARREAAEGLKALKNAPAKKPAKKTPKRAGGPRTR